MSRASSLVSSSMLRALTTRTVVAAEEQVGIFHLLSGDGTAGLPYGRMR